MMDLLLIHWLGKTFNYIFTWMNKTYSVYFVDTEGFPIHGNLYHQTSLHRLLPLINKCKQTFSVCKVFNRYFITRLKASNIFINFMSSFEEIISTPRTKRTDLCSFYYFNCMWIEYLNASRIKNIIYNFVERSSMLGKEESETPIRLNCET